MSSIASPSPVVSWVWLLLNLPAPSIEVNKGLVLVGIRLNPMLIISPIVLETLRSLRRKLLEE